MEPGYCIDCGATIRVKAKSPGTCPYCGVRIATGEDTFRAVEPVKELPNVREYRRRSTRIHGALQLGIGIILIVVLIVLGRKLPTYIAGMIAAHGLYRLLFASGPNRDDEDYDSDD